MYFCRIEQEIGSPYMMVFVTLCYGHLVLTSGVEEEPALVSWNLGMILGNYMNLVITLVSIYVVWFHASVVLVVVVVVVVVVLAAAAAAGGGDGAGAGSGAFYLPGKFVGTLSGRHVFWWQNQNWGGWQSYLELVREAQSNLVESC